MNTKFIKQTSHAFEFYDASSTIERIGRGIYIKNSSGKPVPISYEQVKHLGTSLLKSH